MRIYVAGKSSEAMRCAAFMRRIERLGHAATFDWTADVIRHASSPYTRRQMELCARQDVDAVRRSDATVVLYHAGLRGALVEIGVALAMMTPVLIVGAPPSDACVFFLMCRHVDTEDEAIAFLPQLQALSLAGAA